MSLVLLGEAKFKLHCAEFEHEQLQAWTNPLRLKHTNRLTTLSVGKQGTPQDFVSGRQRRTRKHSTAASCHIPNLGGERHS